MPDELMTIGTFSLLTGLSITTLRHYDDIGLLRPAEVDALTGYRRYRDAQVDTARRVRLLREAELSTDDIAAVIDGDEAAAREVLDRHRAEVRDRVDRLEAVLERLDQEDRMGMTAVDFRLAAVNLGVDSEEALALARSFWGAVLGTSLEDWGTGGRQVVLGRGEATGYLNIRVRSAGEPHFGHATAFGLGVVGLDAAHQRALDAGGAELYGPTDGVNMPRHSLFVDPVGNRIVLWEAG